MTRRNIRHHVRLLPLALLSGLPLLAQAPAKPKKRCNARPYAIKAIGLPRLLPAAHALL